VLNMVKTSLHWS